MSEENNGVDHIIAILGKIDLMLAVADDLNDDMEKVSTDKKYLDSVGGSHVFDTLKNFACLKGYLHFLSADFMEISKELAIVIEGDDEKKPNVPPMVNNMSELVKAMMAVSENNTGGGNIKDGKEVSFSIEKDFEDALNKIPKEKEGEQKKKKKPTKNKHIDNAMDYFKEQFDSDTREDDE